MSEFYELITNFSFNRDARLMFADIKLLIYEMYTLRKTHNYCMLILRIIKYRAAWGSHTYQGIR